MKIIESLPCGVALLSHELISDQRGHLYEAYNEAWFQTHVAPVRFVQENESFSPRSGTIRGLHYQKSPHGQAKLVRCLNGALMSVAVDVRPESAYFGQWFSHNLKAHDNQLVYVPEGFAHGVLTLQDNTVLHFKMSTGFHFASATGLYFADPEVAIDWPMDVADMMVSEKDHTQPRLSQI